MLVVLLPLTEATRGIVAASLLSQLKQDGPLGGPILINAGRGGLQVEADILAALDSGALRGASLDVFEPEPPPKDARLWAHLRSISAHTMRQSPRPTRSPPWSPGR
jgi:glyoxylate/hydroxypyruvate reductase